MLRLLVAFIGIAIFLLPAPVSAGGNGDQKSQVASLYKSYRTSLKAGNSGAALKFAQQIYALTPKVYGRISKTYATVTFNLAQINDLLKNYKAAAKFYQQHIDILDDLKVPEDRRYLAKLGLLSAAYMKISNFGDAAIYGRKALGLAEDLKVSDEILAGYEFNLGIIYYFSSYDKRGKARRHINKAVDLFSSVYGTKHIKTARAMFWRAKLYLVNKKYYRAAEKFENVLSIYEENLPAGNDRILQVHAFLAIAYNEIGEKDKSTEHRIDRANANPSVSVQKYSSIYKDTPIYPRKAQEKKMSGDVVLSFDIDKTGLVENVKVLKSSNKIFDSAAKKAVRKFLYAPAVKDGKRVKTRGVQHKITFKFGR